MKAYIVAHFINGVIIEYKRKPKSDVPQPLTLNVASNAVKRLNLELGENSPHNHWACITIDRLAEYNKARWNQSYTEQSVCV